MDHIKAVIARRVKFIIEKQSFISFAFDTRKGKNLKRVNSIFPSKKRYQDKKLKIKDFLVDYFINVVEKIKGISEFDRDYAKSAYAKYFKRLIRDLHRKLKKKGLCNKFEGDTGIFWAYFTKMVNILVVCNISSSVYTLRGSPVYVHLNGFASLLYCSMNFITCLTSSSRELKIPRFRTLRDRILNHNSI